MNEKLQKLEYLLYRNNYQGHDPFDLPNSPFFSFIPNSFFYLKLIISKFGSRLAPDFLRKLLLVPKIEDPKTFACSYFAFLFSNKIEEANLMIKKLLLNANNLDESLYWGYDFDWPTMDKSLNPRKSSTIVPGSFAMLAIVCQHVVTDQNVYLNKAKIAADYYSSLHLKKNKKGENFIAYFKNSNSNTHNANLLGCASMSLIYNLTQDTEKLKLLADCANSSFQEIDSNGYINYKDSPDGLWTDCFHHLYVIASLKLISITNPYVDKNDYQIKIELMENYYKQNFVTKVGSINYFPNKKYPIDPHNYAATAIFNIIFYNEKIFSQNLLNEIDSIAWLENDGRYIHRINKSGRVDKRFFMRWAQAWMFLAHSVVENNENVFTILNKIKSKIQLVN